ncbi:energy-coupled thiamine transporter ThiT [Clostridium minihomine]|uniref:energy-coupled thiamine transporter ThiT n=1 Tax=Clostridium minihomine TaxID=2045012 RepID=UPI000C78B0C5|nr:energy-coupled thiamine transporter ThiT [Clostridium minihomine]
MKKNSTVTLVECALMIALATVLSMLKIFELPQGGSITLASMVPLVLVSYRHGLKWGLGTAFVHSLLQMLLQFSAPPAKTLGAFALVVLLDYVLAFTVLGSASFWGKLIRSRTASIAFGAGVAVFLRFICSFLSGILIWQEYAPEGTPVWLYSLVYNGSYMLPELIITSLATVALMKVLNRAGGQGSAHAA